MVQPALLDHKDHKVPQEPQVRRAYRVLMELLVSREIKVQLDRRALKVPPDSQAMLVPQVLVAFKD
jgi:hypothetical protein